MKVKELIDELQQFKNDAEVHFYVNCEMADYDGITDSGRKGQYGYTSLPPDNNAHFYINYECPRDCNY